MAANKDDGAEGEVDSEDAVLLKNVDYDVTKAVLEPISATTEAILLAEFDKFLKNDEFMRVTKSNPMSYLSTLAILSFALKEESKENISKLMNAMSLGFDEKTFDMIPKIYERNRLVYVHAFYFLVINGKETSEANIRGVVEALGMEFDKKTFEESLGYICSNTKCGRIQL